MSRAVFNSSQDALEAVPLAIKECGIIAILRGTFTVDQTVAIAEALVDETITVIEVALNSANALEAIGAMRSAVGEAALIGAGTVRSATDLDEAAGVGAQFAVGPSFDGAVLAQARERRLFYLPGVLTPTEATLARVAGCRMQKLFPLDQLGPRYLSAMCAPLDEIEFVPTGGVSAKNARDYRAAGAAAVAVGSSLVSKPGQSVDEVRTRARALRQAWREAI
jgi:Entner-Doudoroff aldolase